jgi:two-component system, OmpR family, sensor histidine kinase ChvG
MRVWKRAWPPSRIGLRLLAFNLLVVFVPVVGVLYLDVYEAQLLHAQEREMVQQGRLLAAAGAVTGALSSEDVTNVLVRLGRQTDARFRVYDASGVLIVDSARIAPLEPLTPLETAYERGGSDPVAAIRARLLYRLGAWLVSIRQRAGNIMRGLLRQGDLPHETGRETELAPELRAALAGRYGATTRETPGQRSLTLFSAVPIRAGDSVVGAVVVSQSTFRVLQAIYDVRLRIFQVVVASILAAAVFTTLAAMTIVRPLRRLRRQATALTDRRGPLPALFPGSARKDELGDLARALEGLTHRVNEHIGRLEGFAADVAHEFKNPLAAIRTAAEMVEQSDRPEDRERFLAMMLRDVDRLERLVSGAREVARLDGAIQNEELEQVSITAAIRDAVETTRMVHPGCIVHVDGGDERIAVRGSRQRLAQVFENLLSNAASFTSIGTAIDVEIATDDSHCSIAISDRGPGIPEAHLERIFERFFSYRRGPAAAITSVSAWPSLDASLRATAERSASRSAMAAARPSRCACPHE